MSKLTGKQQAFVNYYLENGFNATQAAKDAGYGNESSKDGYFRRVGCENVTKCSIKQIIHQKQAEMAEKLDLSREKQHERLNLLYEMAVKQQNVSAGASVIREQNEMLGYHREKGLNPEKEAERATRMDRETKKHAEAVAKLRTAEEAIVETIKPDFKQRAG